MTASLFKEQLVAVFPGCDKDDKSCAQEMQPFFDTLDKAKA